MKLVITLGLLLIAGVSAFASSTATQTVTFQVSAINEIAVSGSPRAMHIAPRTDATDSSVTYALTTNCDNKKIMVALDAPVPEGIVLKVNLAAPSGAKSLGDVVCSTTPTDAVVGVSRVAEKGLTITCKASTMKGDLTFTPGKLILTIADM